MTRTVEADVVRLLGEIGAARTDRYTINVRKRVANYAYLCSMAGTAAEGKRVLDIGCGTGLFGLASALQGARECVGLEMDEEALAKADEQVRELAKRGHSVPVNFQKQNVLEGLPFADAAFDLVLMEEVVSHLADVETVLRESVRVLAPGGVLIVSDNNNPFHAGQQRERIRLWHAFENGPRPGAERFPPHERSYEAMRAHRIGQWCPELPAAEVGALTTHTSGLWGDLLKQECLEYARSGRMPDHVYQHGQCPMHPDGMYIERPIDPYWLCAKLLEYGCASAKAIPHWASGSTAKRMANGMLRSCLPRAIAMRIARGFIAVGRR